MTSNTEAELEHLAERWLTVKDAEREANAERLRIEDKILALFPAKEEGSSSRTLANGYKLKTIGKLSYKADLEKLAKLTEDWEIQPIRLEPRLDEAVLKLLKANQPALWKYIAEAITTKPLKTSVTIEETE